LGYVIENSDGRAARRGSLDHDLAERAQSSGHDDRLAL
jgi:hypothetical protein